MSIQKILDKYGFDIKQYGGDNLTIISYELSCIERDIKLSFSWLASSDLEAYLKWSGYKLIAVLLNGVRLDNTVYDTKSITKFVNTHYIRLNPTEKLDRILEYITYYTVYDGQTIRIDGPDEDDVAGMYFRNCEEWWFYLKSGIDQGFIRSVKSGEVVDEIHDHTPILNYGLTVEGLSRLIKVNESKASNYCFVAMSFDDELDEIYTNAIEPAIIETGFIPIRIDRVHIDADKTINDEIISGIKKARFTIADFTNHKDGVYFEAGYALGKGKKVIYSCKQDQIGKAHFDIRNYQHVLWQNESDFKKKLIHKIEAFIKD